MGHKNAANRKIVLRGYVKQEEPSRHVAVCLTLNLVTEGRSQRQALQRMMELIGAYLKDASENNELADFVPRRAPLHFYMEYITFCVVGAVLNLLRLRRSSTFKDCRLITAHA